MYVDDHNRIILNPLEDYAECQGGFVNACYIDVSFLSKQLGNIIFHRLDSLRVEDVVCKLSLLGHGALQPELASTSYVVTSKFQCVPYGGWLGSLPFHPNSILLPP